MPDRMPNSRASYDAVETTARSLTIPRPPTTTGLPGELGLAQDLHRRQEHVEVDVQHPCGSCRPRSGGGGSASVDSSSSSPVSSSRSATTDRSCASITSVLRSAVRSTRPVASPTASRTGRAATAIRSAISSRRHHVGGVGQVAAEPGVGRGHRPAAVRRDRRPPDQHAGAAQRAVERVDQVDHPAHAGLVADPERRGGDDGQPLVGRRAQLGDVVVGRPRVGEQLERVVDLALVHHVAGRAQQLGDLADHPCRLLARSSQRRGRDDGGGHQGHQRRRSARRSSG